MTKNCVNWKKIACVSRHGKPYLDDMASVINRYYKLELLPLILSMPSQKPISFDDAVRLAGQKFIESMDNYDIAKAISYYKNFLTFISDSGYHIEVTGDEFEFLNQAHSPA
jgi:hypothetical protein